MPEPSPSLDRWIDEAVMAVDPARTGMFLVHNGVVRGSSRSGAPVDGMRLRFDRERLDEAVHVARSAEGITFVRAWVNQGDLNVGDDIMKILVAGDIRDNVFDALRHLVSTIKSDVVVEDELLAEP